MGTVEEPDSVGTLEDNDSDEDKDSLTEPEEDPLVGGALDRIVMVGVVVVVVVVVMHEPLVSEVDWVPLEVKLPVVPLDSDSVVGVDEVEPVDFNDDLVELDEIDSELDPVFVVEWEE